MLAAPGSSYAQGAAPDGMSPQVFQQIQAIIKDKSQLTEAQQKLQFGLLQASRIAKGQPPVPGLDSSLPVPNLVDNSGNTLVDIVTTDASGLVPKIQSLGGTVVSSFPQYNAVRANMPAAALEALAAEPSVKTIKPAEFPQTNRIVAPPRPSFDQGSAAVRDQLAKALGGRDPGAQPQVGKGATVSEAVVTHGADVVQNAGITGAGVKVCVMSNGISTLAARTAAGELPAVQILGTGQGGSSGDEGTAMLELVADIAPGASLGWSTANGGKAQMAQNILDLKNVMGCQIIVDDLTYFAEGAFQEDIIANAVTTVVTGGAMYFSSAANSGHLSGNQSGTWEGDFVDGGAVSGPIATAGETGNFHNFGGGVLFDTITANAPNVSLKWSDPLGASTNDYDVFVTNSTGTTLIAFSAAVQNGTQDPFEFITCTNAACPTVNGAKVFPPNMRIYIVKFSGAARALRLDTHRGRLSIATNGSTFGHNGGVNTIAVAAVSNNFLPITGRRFAASDTIATYSSDGPRKLFLNPTPATTYITPGCFTFGCAGGGGTLLPKVDIAAADCNTTTTPNFAPFCGTSAAAPNAAAIAALFKSSPLGLTNAAILAAMKSTAIDIMVAGVDVDSGAGIVMADGAVPGTLQVSPATNIAATGNTGGPFTPASFNYTLSASSSNLNYSISGVPSWLTASSTTGTVTATGTTVTFTVNASANSLSAGTQTATITITNTTNGKGNTTRPATLSVLDGTTTSLVSAVLPASRSVQVNTVATAFGTIINAGSNKGVGCALSLGSSIPATFGYQTTNPATNALTGTPNTPVDITAGNAQSFVFSVMPTAALNPTDVVITASCANASAAPTVVGLNTLLLSASNTPVPDIVALGATATNDGILSIQGSNGAGAFAVATVNVGAAGAITASADTGSAGLGLQLSVCQTNPNGSCQQNPAASVTTTIATNATPTFSIFAQANGSVAFDPANNRIFVRFKDAGNVTRGSTSVAVRTQ